MREIESQYRYFNICIYISDLYTSALSSFPTLNASSASSDLRLDLALHPSTRCSAEVSRTILGENPAIRYHPETAIASCATEKCSQSRRHDTDTSRSRGVQGIDRWTSPSRHGSSTCSRVRCRADLTDPGVDRRLPRLIGNPWSARVHAD